jgi:hypothetical protein
MKPETGKGNKGSETPKSGSIKVGQGESNQFGLFLCRSRGRAKGKQRSEVGKFK